MKKVQRIILAERGVGIRCEKCRLALARGEKYSHGGKDLCEDCYMEAVSVEDLRSAVGAYRPGWIGKKGLSGAEELLPIQEAILNLIKERKRVTREEVLEEPNLSSLELEKNFAVLRHCELAKGEKVGKQVYFTTFGAIIGEPALNLREFGVPAPLPGQLPSGSEEMGKQDFYEELIERFTGLIREHDLLGERIEVRGRILKPDEAIGTPQRQDFPLLKGKEKLMEALFRGARGQAFTDMPENFAGTLEEIVRRPVESNYDRAVLISSINAVCNHLGVSRNNIHCKNEEPEECAAELGDYIEKEFGSPRIAFVGFQPAMIQELAGRFTMRVVDLDEDNIGAVKYGVKIEDGGGDIAAFLDWADLVVATGSSVVNGTLPNFLTGKPVLFYGTTVAGTAALMGLRKFCARGL